MLAASTAIASSYARIYIESAAPPRNHRRLRNKAVYQLARAANHSFTGHGQLSTDGSHITANLTDAWEDNLDIVRALLARGADVIAQDDAGPTPLRLARKGANLSRPIIAELMEVQALRRARVFA